MKQLVISDDEGKTTIVPLEQGELTIGRGEGNTVRLLERNVSRKHARLIVTKSSLTIEDLGSYNGVKVNGHKISGQRTLRSRDLIQIGDYRLSLRAKGGVIAADDAHTASFAPVSDAETAMIAMPAGGTLTPPGIVPARLLCGRLVPVAPATGRARALDRDEIVIGSAETCGVVLRHRSVSGEHAKILRVNQVYRILDLDSTNGVRVNGSEVRYAELDDGDEITLGEVVLRFEIPGASRSYPGARTTRIPLRARGPSNRFVLAGVAAIAILAGLTIAVILRPRGPANASVTTPNPTAPLLPPPPGHAGGRSAPGDPIEEARELRRHGDFEAALRMAQEARRRLAGAGRSTTEADALIQGLGYELQGQRQLAQVRRSQSGSAEAVFAAAQLIPQGTAAYEDPLVVQNAIEVYGARLEEARRSSRRGEASAEVRSKVEEILADPRVTGATDAQTELQALRAAAQAVLADLDERGNGHETVARVQVPRQTGSRVGPPTKAPTKAPGPTKAPTKAPPQQGGPAPNEAALWRAVLSAPPDQRKARACAFARQFPGTPNGRQAARLCQL
ncbi:MAG: FHA domain-containing protein [Deltaproteobacteria bacterium]|nr:FHA domain-containing protein [Deltaproteobacteria bacterium]